MALTVKRLVMTVASASVLPSCLCSLPSSSLVFLGSTVGDCMLIGYEKDVNDHREDHQENGVSSNNSCGTIEESSFLYFIRSLRLKGSRQIGVTHQCQSRLALMRKMTMSFCMAVAQEEEEVQLRRTAPLMLLPLSLVPPLRMTTNSFTAPLLLHCRAMEGLMLTTGTRHRSIAQ